MKFFSTPDQPARKWLLLIAPGLLACVVAVGAVWQQAVRHRFAPSNMAISPRMTEAEQNALSEKSAYQAADFRMKRLRQEALARYEIERLRLRAEMLPRYAALKYYSVLSALIGAGLSVIALFIGLIGAKMRRASVCMARIGKHSEIPVHYNDLQNFYPIAVNLSLAEIEASASASHDAAYQISRQMMEDILNYTRALAGKRGLLPPSGMFAEKPAETAMQGGARPTFAELLQSGMIAAGKPLICGYDSQGQPQLRELKSLKTLAVTGLQGSGKTVSMAYLVASAVVACQVQAYVIDPHKEHPESLSALLAPLEPTGYVTLVNPLDTPRVIRTLHQTLDRRLNGQEPSAPGILLVIDELARLSKMDCFNVLLDFLERCTEETRKANITFIGSSPKWTARHFNGRADIRRCMNAVLIHKTKPSQADLLMEDAEHKRLVRELEQPGEAVFATDYSEPLRVAMPLCTREDMQTVAQLVGVSREKWLTNLPDDVPVEAVEEEPPMASLKKARAPRRKKAAA